MIILSTGLKIRLAKEMDPKWNKYNKTVASTHLSNYGVVLVSEEFGDPIDNEYDLELFEQEIFGIGGGDNA